jgi:hypothetical protein
LRRLDPDDIFGEVIKKGFKNAVRPKQSRSKLALPRTAGKQQ